MAGYILREDQPNIVLPAQQADRLIGRGDGDAALLYLALLRRQGAQVDALSFGNTTLDLASGTLCCAEKSVRLSAREFDVMRLLLQSGGSNLSKEALLSRVWGLDSNAVENSVEVYVGFLRKKLASIGSNVRIESVRRLGYHLEVASSC